MINSELDNILSIQKVIDDCNSVVQTCLGTYRSSSLNTPGFGSYGMIFTYIGEAGAWHFQVAIATDNTIWERSNINSAGWSDWIQLSTV